jgi:hypothetical protein
LAPSDLDMTITEANGGFQIRALALRREPDGTLAARQLEAAFAPTEVPGVFAFDPGSGSLLSSPFADPAVGNPLKGDTLLWARLQDDTLHVCSLAIDPAGGFALEHSTGRLTDDGMVAKYELRSQNDWVATVEVRLERGGTEKMGPEPRLAAALALLALTLAAPAGARAASLEPLFGTYVGVAQVEDIAKGDVRQRDMDIVIEPYKQGGFRIQWVNVSLVNGKRAVPGVERRVQTVLFEPARDRGFFIEAAESSPFRLREETRPMRGDPVRWASLDDQGLHVYSFVVLEDGRYELQVYDRTLTDIGLDISFKRIVDGAVMRRITGTTARANVAPKELVENE